MQLTGKQIKTYINYILHGIIMIHPDNFSKSTFEDLNLLTKYILELDDKQLEVLFLQDKI